MEINFFAILVATIIPTITGFIWYNPSVLGKAWMEASGLTEEKIWEANMLVIFGVSFLLAFMLAYFAQILSIHQFSLFSLLINEPGMKENPITNADFLMMIEKYGSNFRTFHHGIVHGIFSSLFFVLPVLGTNSLFERKGFKYILINVGYWTLTLALMCGVVCGWQSTSVFNW